MNTASTPPRFMIRATRTLGSSVARSSEGIDLAIHASPAASIGTWLPSTQ